MVNFRGPADLVGRLIDLRITSANSHSLRGEALLQEEAIPAG
jgi:tRNA-2-methylthio-N6-dimethylallyladenosine synthase